MECQEKVMEDAISIANYFIERSNDSKSEITLLKLVKLTYIAHGFLLALLNKSYINPRFDRVEAWRLGPVIPSVYHTFKYNGSSPITEKGKVLTDVGINDCGVFVCPKVKDETTQVLDFVMKRYGKMEAESLVDILHRKGTPWDYYYKPGQNVIIPDEDTQIYYKALWRELNK